MYQVPHRQYAAKRNLTALQPRLYAMWGTHSFTLLHLCDGSIQLVSDVPMHCSIICVLDSYAPVRSLVISLSVQQDMDNLVRKAGKTLAVFGIVQRLWLIQQCFI